MYRALVHVLVQAHMQPCWRTPMQAHWHQVRACAGAWLMQQICALANLPVSPSVPLWRHATPLSSFSTCQCPIYTFAVRESTTI